MHSLLRGSLTRRRDTRTWGERDNKFWKLFSPYLIIRNNILLLCAFIYFTQSPFPVKPRNHAADRMATRIRMCTWWCWSENQFNNTFERGINLLERGLGRRAFHPLPRAPSPSLWPVGWRWFYRTTREYYTFWLRKFFYGLWKYEGSFRARARRFNEKNYIVILNNSILWE